MEPEQLQSPMEATTMVQCPRCYRWGPSHEYKSHLAECTWRTREFWTMPLTDKQKQERSEHRGPTMGGM